MKAIPAIIFGVTITAALALGLSKETTWPFAVFVAIATVGVYTLLLSFLFKPAANRQPRP